MNPIASLREKSGFFSRTRLDPKLDSSYTSVVNARKALGQRIESYQQKEMPINTEQYRQMDKI